MTKNKKCLNIDTINALTYNMLCDILITQKSNALLKWNPVRVWNGPAIVQAFA